MSSDFSSCQDRRKLLPSCSAWLCTVVIEVEVGSIDVGSDAARDKHAFFSLLLSILKNEISFCL